MLSFTVRVNGSVGRVDGKQHRALEPVLLRENASQLRQRFLRPVLLVAADKHDVFPFTGPSFAFENDAGREREARAQQRQKTGQFHALILSRQRFASAVRQVE